WPVRQFETPRTSCTGWLARVWPGRQFQSPRPRTITVRSYDQQRYYYAGQAGSSIPRAPAPHGQQVYYADESVAQTGLLTSPHHMTMRTIFLLLDPHRIIHLLLSIHLLHSMRLLHSLRLLHSIRLLFSLLFHDRL
ncbi:Unknown protein, partial [Striga hermonthica]